MDHVPRHRTSLDSLLLSKDPAAIKLIDAILDKAPDILVPTAIVAAATPDAAATALKLLEAYPTVELDAATLEPLLAKDDKGNSKLKKLACDEKPESRKLFDALCVKSKAIKAAAPTTEMLLHSVWRGITSPFSS